MPGAPADPVRRRVLLAGLGAVAFAGLVPACTDDGGSADGDDEQPRSSGTVPQPAGFVRTTWSTDPHALGSYTFLPVGSTPDLRDALAEPVSGRIHFAGEATWRKNPSTVHGAQASGAKVAKAIGKAKGDDGQLDIVVVGAGVAGARAAFDLTEAGHRVIVVESQATVGGRTKTVRPEGWPVPVELGASWVHDIEASDLAEQLDDLGIESVPYDYTAAVLTPSKERVPGITYNADAAGAVVDALIWAEDQDRDVSVAEALDESGAARGVADPALAHFLRTEVTTEYGADADQLSAWWGYEGTEGDDRLVTGGYGALAEHDLQDIDVRYGWSVASIAIEADDVAVTSTTGDVFRADRVVVTVPLGVLKAGTIAFTPPLPAETQAAIDGLGVALLDKVWLRWDEPWWSEIAEQWTLVTDEEPYGEWFNLLDATGEPILLGLVGGANARELSERSDDDVLAACLSALQRFADAGW